MVEPVPEATQAGELFRMAGVKLPSSGTTLTDQAELLREQVKILSAEVAFCTSNLKRLMDQRSKDPKHEAEIQRQREDLSEKKRQLRMLEERMLASSDLPINGGDTSTAEMAKTIAKLKAVLSEKTFDMEVVSADNRILQDSLRAKTKQNEQLLEEVNLLRVELTKAMHGQGEEGARLSKNFAKGSDSVELKRQLQMSQEEAFLLRHQQQQMAKELAEAKALAVMQAPSSGQTQVSSKQVEEGQPASR